MRKNGVGSSNGKLETEEMKNSKEKMNEKSNEGQINDKIMDKKDEIIVKNKRFSISDILTVKLRSTNFVHSQNSSCTSNIGDGITNNKNGSSKKNCNDTNNSNNDLIKNTKNSLTASNITRSTRNTPSKTTKSPIKITKVSMHSALKNALAKKFNAINVVNNNCNDQDSPMSLSHWE